MNKNNKEKWVKEVLNSIEGCTKAAPSERLYAALEKRITIPVTKGRVISFKVVSAAAACIILLISVNMYVLQKQSTSRNTETNKLQDIVRYYDITNDKEIGGI
jgi:hypothetical protein